MRQAVILCGGKGTRLGADFSHLPKPLVPVDGIPLLDRILGVAAEAGIKEVILAAGHLGHLIAERYQAVNPWRLNIRTHVEKTPLGTAGCLLEISDQLDEHFALLYGDIFLDFDLAGLIRRHETFLPDATVLVRQSDHPADSDLVDVDLATGEVRAFLPKATRDPAGLYRNCGNAAVYCCSRRLLAAVPQGRPSDIATDVFPALLAEGGRIRACWLEDTGYVKDVGTPARLVEVERYWRRRQLARAAAAAPRRVRAVILDRDGVIVENREPLAEVAHMTFLPGALEGLRLMNEDGLACFVATNQPWIARGLLTEEQMTAVHGQLLTAVNQAGGGIRAIAHSPYHPETHHGEGIPGLRRASECRKPRPGMLFALMEEHGFLPDETVMVGDSPADITAGKNAGVRTVLIRPASAGGSLETIASMADATVEDLQSAAAVIRTWSR
ncbi:MAG: D,D-heptose 1,7-bisphosphate phosphatase [Verrucomicrobiales bacterium]|nr:D,D-heptose 1,7-bisphosphate phosphatase [Verrucomicrobiales bacterium]